MSLHPLLLQALDVVCSAVPEGFNARELVALTHLPRMGLIVVAAVLVTALALSLRATRGATLSTRVGLFVLRALLMLAVFALVLEPGLRSLATSRDANRVVIALDTSESMSEVNASVSSSDSREQQGARAALALVDDLQKRSEPFSPEVWLFDGTFRPAAPNELEQLASGALKATGTDTRLSVPVTSTPLGEGTKPLGGVVLISDGADTSGLGTALTAGLRDDVQKLQAPLHTVSVGEAEAWKDIALDRVIADEFAFVRNKVSLDVIVRHKGFAGTTLPLTLKEDGRVVATTNVTLSDDEVAPPAGTGVRAESKATFTFEPQRAGKRVYTVSTPVHPDEKIAENNRLDFTLKIIRDRIRVLQVAGKPSWDERFVRRLLKENPSVDLISFFILRSTTDVSGASNRELSLIPFPTHELFTEQLGTFDVVIFQDFNYRPYQMGMYLDNVRKFVEEQGGGFLMIGGALSFSEGEYDGTPVADILPVRLLPGTGHTSVERFRPLVTDAGRSHPITDLGDVATTREGFDALPELEGLNLTAGLVPGAEALLAHPFLNADGKPAPVVAVREVGKGRSMAVLTDTTWLWSLPHVGAGGRGDAHRRFYANALRWLIRDPELSRVKVSVELPSTSSEKGPSSLAVEPGAAVPLTVLSENEKYQPEGGAHVKLTLQPLDDGAQQPIVQEGDTADDGTWHTTFTPPSAGAWRVHVEAAHDGKSIGSDEDAFVVRATHKERLFREPRPDVLAALAAAGAGKAVTTGDITSLPFLDHEVTRVHKQKTEPLWNRFEALAIVMLLAGAEWWWRRRKGFA